MEFWCHYCHEWYDTEYCKAHFEGVHGQKDVTFEALKKRLEPLGGLDVREERPSETDDEKNVFVTNNFKHIL